MILGKEALRWFGEIIGVNHLIIVPGRKVTLGSTGRTSQYDKKRL